MKKLCVLLIICITLYLVHSVYAEEYIQNDVIYTNGKDFYAIKSDNSLWKWTEKDMVQITPQKIMDNVITVNGNYAIKEDHTLWTWNDAYQFEKIMDNVKYVSCGGTMVLILKDDNTLWGMGYNEYGQLGLGTFDNAAEVYIPSHYEQPQKIAYNVKKVSAGSKHSVIMKTDGSIYTTGNNMYGQLGIGEYINQNNAFTKVFDGINATDILAGCDATFVFDNNNYMWMCGTMFPEHTSQDGLDRYIPQIIEENTKMISNHYKRSLILKTDNPLSQYAFDDSEKNANANIIKIADDVNCISGWTYGGLYKTLVLKNDGTLYKYDLNVDGYKLDYIMNDIKIKSNLSDIEQNKINFNDILNNSKEQQLAINSLEKAGIVEGVSESDFAPDKLLTRAEIAALMMRMLAIENVNSNGGFFDVTEDKWYYGIAGASKEANIIAGYEDNTFRGDETITKLQLVSLISRTLRNENKAEINTTGNELQSIPSWAKEDIKTGLANNIITKEDLNDINCEISRADAAVLLYRLYGKI